MTRKNVKMLERKKKSKKHNDKFITDEKKKTFVRKQSKVTQKHSRDMYQSLIETTGDFIWETDTKGRYIYCSPQTKTLWGIEPEDMLGKTPLDMMSEEGRKQNGRYFQTILKKPKPLTMQCQSYDIAGHLIILDVRGVPFFDSQGKLLGFRGITRDVTEQKKAEEALLEAKHQLEKKVKERTAELEQINKRLKEENQKRLHSLKSLMLEESRLDALFQLSQLSKASLNKITNVTLEKAISLTQSKIGFIGMLNEEETIYTLHSVSKEVNKDCNVAGNPIHWPVNDAGIWADAIRNRKTLIINNYSKPNPRKKGIPSGHLQLERFIIVPIFEDKKIVVVAGVANKISDYNESDERQMILLLNGMWGYVQKNRSREKLQKAYDELEEKVKQRTTELEVANQELHKSENRLRHAQEIARLGNWELNLLHNTLIWSDEVYRIFGIQPHEFNATYETFLEYVHPDDRIAVDAAYTKSLHEGQDNYEIEHRIIRKNGEIRFVLEKCEHIRDKTGKITHSIGMIQDITERKQIEKNIQELNQSLIHKANELVAINKELEAFNYSVSHDLRAPLRSIDGFSEWLLDDYADRLDAKGKEYIHRIRNATKRMEQLIDDMLRLSRISRSEAIFQRVNLGEMAQSIMKRLKKEEPTKKIKFILDDNLIAKGDPHLLYILLENLLGNAWKFTKKRKQATIEFRKTQKGKETVFFIRDNGAGFNMKYADKLFIPFQRLHNNSEYPGTGIGLCVVSRIINRHKGRIWVEAEEEKGAIFYFTIGENT